MPREKSKGKDYQCRNKIFVFHSPPSSYLVPPASSPPGSPLEKHADCQIFALFFLAYLPYFVAIGWVENLRGQLTSRALAVFNRQVVDFSHTNIAWIGLMANISNG
ncbi:MAG TPA: hypothetical protein VG028_03320 [Terriglobia bacterium]|nr:hypothetical protein [Terriglobia bacterium]